MLLSQTDPSVSVLCLGLVPTSSLWESHRSHIDWILHSMPGFFPLQNTLTSAPCCFVLPTRFCSCIVNIRPLTQIIIPKKWFSSNSSILTFLLSPSPITISPNSHTILFKRFRQFTMTLLWLWLNTTFLYSPNTAVILRRWPSSVASSPINTISSEKNNAGILLGYP